MSLLKKEDIQEILSEELDNLEKVSGTYDIQKTPRQIWQEEDFKAMLKNYTKKYGVDIQQELRAYLTPVAMEKLKASLEGKDIGEIKKEEQKELVKEKAELSKEGIALEKPEEKKLEEKVEQEKEKGNEVNIQAEAIKAIYNSILEEYYNLKENLQTGVNGKIQTGSLSVGDKMGTKLVMYERYLQKLDTRYRGITGQNIVKDDDETREKETLFAGKDEHNESRSNKKFEKNVDDINRLLDERAEIEEKMAVVISKARMLSQDDFNSQINALQEEYLEVTARLHLMEPNIHELEQDIAMHESDEKFRDRTLGNAFDKYHNRNLRDDKVAADSRKNDEKVKDIKEDFNNKVSDTFVSTQDVAQDTLDDYREAEKKGDTERAEEILQTAEGMAGISTAERKAPEENSTDVKSQEEYGEAADTMSEDKKASNKNSFDPRLNAVATDEETLEQENERKAKEEREKRAEVAQEKINSNNAMERSLYNRK